MVRFASMLVLIACGSSDPTLRVDLRTDLIPLVEVTNVTAELQRDGAVVATAGHVVTNADYATGVRIADFEDLPSGAYLLTVVAAGTISQTQRVLVRVRGDTATTVLMTRDCRDVDCTDPASPTCINATCVPGTCTGEALDECGAPECDVAACGAIAACATADCTSGACLVTTDDAACAADERCDPVAGCVGDGMPPGTPVRADQVVVSRWATCARLGTEVTCWGNNVEGELGVVMAGEYRPTRIAVRADQLAASNFTMCARSGGEVRCWGSNREGQLGQGDTTNRRGEIVTVPLVDPAVDLFGIGSGFCVTDAMGRYSCWGSNMFRQLVPWMDRDVVAPIVGMQADVIDVAGGEDHLCYLKSSEQVFCLGRGLSGELGDGAEMNSETAVEVRLPSPGTALSIVRPPRDAARSTTCALGRDTQVSCWGFDDAGQIGSGGGIGEFAPLPSQTLGLIDVVELYDTMRPVFARLADGTVMGWGARTTGLFGDGDGEGWEEAPVATPLGRFEGLAFGFTHACGLEAGEVWCWGFNDAGTLPDVVDGGIAVPFRITY